MHRTFTRSATLASFCLLVALNAVAQPASPSSSATTDKGGQLASAPVSPKAIRAANRALSKRVLKALSRVKGLDASGIFVKASDGTITLSGVVQKNGQIPLAVDAARNVEGVKSVRESLRLETQPTE